MKGSRRKFEGIGLAVVALGVVAATLVGTRSADAGRANSGDVYALTESQDLITFDAAAPKDINSRVAVAGLAVGERLLSIDFRPANGMLYGLGSTSQLYVIDTSTGIATKVGTGFATLLDGTSFGFDFNPTVDRIRIVSDTGQNLRVHPDTGAIASVDKPLVLASAGGAPNVTAAAYTNPDTDPTTGTTLFDIDTGLDALVTQAPPNDGVLNAVGTLRVDAESVTGFDIGSDGIALAALQRDGTPFSRLYAIDLESGRAKNAGKVADGEVVTALAIDLD